MDHGRTVVSAAVLAAAGLLITGLFGTTLPGAAAGAVATLSASPATNLADGQYVKLSYTGFGPGIGLAFRQCVTAPRSLELDCTAVNQDVFGITDSSGAGDTYIPVHSGNDPSAQNAAGTGPIPCDSAHTCVIAGLRSANDLATAVFAPISFGPSPDTCPPPGPGSVLGAGSASAYRAMFAWESSVCQPPASISAGYTFSSSADGISNFQKGLTDFGVTGPGTETAPAPATGVPFTYAPLTASAVSIAFRMYDRRGPQISSLVLTPELVAKVFLGQVSNWNVNPDILALNPGVEFPPRVVPFARAESSSQSYVFTSWLARAAPTTWTAGAQQIFPQGGGQVVGVTGSAGMGRAVVDPTTDFFGQGNVGFMDSSTAAFYGLPTIQIKRADGSVIAATQDSIRAALSHAALSGDGTITPDYATADPLAYPMLMPTYMVAPTGPLAAGHGATLAAFLRYAVQGGQSHLPPGYAPLSPNLVSRSLSVAGAISTAASVSPMGPSLSAPAAPFSPGSSPVALEPTGALAGALPGISSLRPLPGLLNGPPIPSAPAAECAAPRCPGPRGPGAIRRLARAAANHGAEVALLAQLGDATASRYVLPSIAAAGVLSVLIGSVIQLLERRRRAEVNSAAGEHVYAIGRALLLDGHE